jgi:formamidopyrimidine-DNA glycosylase
MITFSMRAKSSMEAGTDLISAMPELAEVEFARKHWDPGLGQLVLAVQLHAEKRIFRGSDPEVLAQILVRQYFLCSVARGKQLLFVFSAKNREIIGAPERSLSWLGIHLGMSGSLRCERPDFVPGKHDHLVLRQKRQALVFRDPRQFGRVRFHCGKAAPEWWNTVVPEIVTPEFNLRFIERFLGRHSRAPIKAVLLRQDGFPGIGNWMADEILWRALILPSRPARLLGKAARIALLRQTKFVARSSLKILGHDDSNLPRGWLIHQRWNRDGICPRHRTPLRHATIGGRTTAWCPRCQK